MTEQDSFAKQTALQALLASGFPFQTSIAQLVQGVSGFESIKEEFPWQDDNGDHFIDLLVFLRGTFIVAMECKKTQKEIFTFLQPDSRQDFVLRSRCAYVNHTVHDSRIYATVRSADWKLKPESQESAFCVVSTSESGKDQRLLEKDAQLLIRGIDKVGRQQMYDPKCLYLGRAIVPVIVTNAKLFSARYDPEKISLDSGQIPMTPAPELVPIEWVRFRKAFTADSGPDMDDRTVFVVAASSLHKFLSELNSVDFNGRYNEFILQTTYHLVWLQAGRNSISWASSVRLAVKLTATRSQGAVS